MTGRLIAMALIVSLGGGSTAFAGETLLESGSRIIAKAVQGQVQPVESRATSSRAVVATPPATLVARINPLLGRPSFAQEGNTLSESGMSRRTKLLLFLAAGVGFAVSAYMIDQNVVDITPSSLGQRQD